MSHVPGLQDLPVSCESRQSLGLAIVESLLDQKRMYFFQGDVFLSTELNFTCQKA